MVQTRILQPGQALQIRWREQQRKPKSIAYDNLRRLRLTPEHDGCPDCPAFATFIDREGISVYIVRGYTYGGDIQGYVPLSVGWRSYFEPLDVFNSGYTYSKHFTREFPADFL